VIRSVVIAGFAIAALAGCSVSVGGPPRATSAKVAEVMASGQGEFDLTTPPSRAEAGMLDGEETVTYENKKKPFQVKVRLPETKEINVSSRLVGFDSISEPEPKTSPPGGMDIHSYPDTPQAGRDQMLAEAQRFGFDTNQINRWYDEAAGPASSNGPSTVTSLWLTSKVGYLTLQMRGTYSRPIEGTRDSGQTDVHYLLTW
jgi:hypothetical protein